MKKKPKIHKLAEQLFDIGIAGWREADKKKSLVKFSQIDNPGQIAGWYAIAYWVQEQLAECEKSK